MRAHIGLDSHLPVPGDKLVCLKHNHNTGLLNGGTWKVLRSDVLSEDRISLFIEEWGMESPSQLEVEAHRHYFESREKDIPHWEVNEADAFDYGYALTVHKAQGSQWRNVLLIDESDAFRAFADRWLYTGLTRAQEQITVVR